jgi:hypothetical protein
VSRIVDRGAITAAYVGIGMAVTIVVSFLLIIPIGSTILIVFGFFSGLMIGYYANQRSDRRAGPWSRILRNGLFASVVTGLSLALVMLGVFALFFFADNGYRDESAGGPIPCTPGADCVYQRYLVFEKEQGRADLAEAGVTDASSFTSYYWSSQLSTAAFIVVITTIGGLGGALAYGVTRPRAKSQDETVTTAA